MSKQFHRFWSQSEVRQLKALYSTTTNKELAELLRRPVASVTHKLNRLRLNRPLAHRQTVMRRIAIRNYGNGRPNVSGSKHHNWKGGFISQSRNRYHFTYMPDHPNAVHGGKYIMTHRLEMERKLGRLLTAKEVVHHIDHNTLNNDPTNLQLCADNAEHRAIHARDAKLKRSGNKS